MSVNATTTVSISPVSIRAVSCSTLRWRSLRMLAPSSQQAAQQRGGVVAVVLHLTPCPRGVPGEDRLDDPGVLRVGVLDVRGQHRDRGEHLVQGRLDRRDGLDQPPGAGDRGDRQVEPRVGLPVRRRSARTGDCLVGALQGSARGVGQLGAGRDLGSTRLDQASELERIQPVQPPRRSPARRTSGRESGLERDHGAPSASPARPYQSRLPEGGHRLPQGRPGHVHPLGQLALRRQRAVSRVDPQPDRRTQLFHAGLERVMAADWTEHRLAEAGGLARRKGLGRRVVGGGHVRQSHDASRATSMVWVQTFFHASRRRPDPAGSSLPRNAPLSPGVPMSDATRDGSGLSADDQLLAKLGYKQELSRSWSGFSNFAISFSIISILAGCFTTFGQAWNNGGPVAISWGWPIISTFILIIGFTMSELVSAYPTSGGIYWWASKMGGPAAGFFTGWLNLIGLLAVTASVAYGTATFLDLTISTISSSWADGYSLTRVFLLFVAIMVLAALANIFSGHLLAMINNISVWWHVAGASLVILILIFVPDHHQSISYVFTERINNSGFNN